MNALKHGMASRQNTVLGEDPRELEEQLEAWVDDLEPEGPAEVFLVRNACLAEWKLARVTRAQNTRICDRMKSASQAEENELSALLDRLLHNPQRPAELYGSNSYDPNEPRISWSESPESRGEPARLVQEISGSAAGCTLLLSRWQALRSRLEPGKTWDRHDMFRCIRLLGRQPLDGLDSRSVALVFVACWAIDPRGDDPLAPLKDELDDDEFGTFVRRVRSRWTDLPQSGDPEGARLALAALVDQAISELSARLAAFNQNAEAARRIDRLSFDDSPEGERLRRYELSCARTVFRSLSELTKLRRAKARDAAEPLPAPDELVTFSDEPGEGLPSNPAPCEVDSIDEPYHDNEHEPADGKPLPMGAGLLTPPSARAKVSPRPSTGSKVDNTRADEPSGSPAPAEPARAQILDNEPEPGRKHPANPQPDGPAAAAEPSNPPSAEPRRALVVHSPPSWTGRTASGDMKAAVVDALRRREAETSARDGPPVQDHRGRRGRRGKHRRTHQKPPNFDLAFSSPLLAPVSPGEYSKILDQVHRELEEELP